LAENQLVATLANADAGTLSIKSARPIQIASFEC